MENGFTNVTLNSTKPEPCLDKPEILAVHALIDLVTFLMGQPVMVGLMWYSSTSKKTIDVLNLNLALFHTLHYSMTLLDAFVLFLSPQSEAKVLTFLLSYVKVGGPMNLCSICTERYVAVLHPTSYPLLNKYRFREISATAVWLLSVLTAVLSVLVTRYFPWASDAVEILPGILMLTMTALIVRLSVCIARGLKRSGPSGREEIHPTKRRALKTVSATSSIAFLCFFTVNMLQRFGKAEGGRFLMTPMLILILSVGSLVHPVFYLSTQEKLFACLK